MGTYNVPRNLRGETRILVIFTIKSLATTAIGLMLGVVFFFIFSLMNLKSIGICVMLVFAAIGFVVGRFNIPTIPQIPVTKKIGGVPIGQIILRYINFKRNRKLYVYTKEEE